MNDELKIESGIPVPPRYATITPLYATLKQMKSGQSVLIPEGYSKAKTDLSTLVYCWARSVGLKGKFVTRKTEGGHRVWRV